MDLFDDVTASRGFINSKKEQIGFFVKRLKDSIVLEIDTELTVMDIPLTKEALKQLEIMFHMAAEDDYPNNTNNSAFDSFKRD